MVEDFVLMIFSTIDVEIKEKYPWLKREVEIIGVYSSTLL